MNGAAEFPSQTKISKSRQGDQHPPLFFGKDFIYLFERERERERGRDTGRGRSRLHAGSLMWDLIPGL